MAERIADTQRGAETASELLVNGEPCQIAVGSNLRELLSKLGLEGRRVAIAIDRRVVPRSRYDAVVLAAGDRVEILEAVGGG